MQTTRLSTAILLVLLTLEVTSGERIKKNLAQTRATITAEEESALLSELEVEAVSAAEADAYPIGSFVFMGGSDENCISCAVKVFAERRLATGHIHCTYWVFFNP